MEKDDKKIINTNVNVISPNIVIQNSSSNNINQTDNKNIYTYRKIFKCDKKESPKKISHSLPRFNVIKDESNHKPAPVDLFKFKIVGINYIISQMK